MSKGFKKIMIILLSICAILFFVRYYAYYSTLDAKTERAYKEGKTFLKNNDLVGAAGFFSYACNFNHEKACELLDETREKLEKQF